MITDTYIHHLLLWPRDAVSWDPLCSHLSLTEMIRGDLNKSAEELELVAAIRKARAKGNNNKRSQKLRARKRKEDLDGYRAQTREQKAVWSLKNPDKVLKTAEKVRNKAKDEERFYCDTCEQALASQNALDKHYHTQAHQDRAAGLEKPAITKSAVAVNAVRAEAVKNKTHYCSVCDKAFGNDFSLQRHLTTALHAKKSKLRGVDPANHHHHI